MNEKTTVTLNDLKRAKMREAEARIWSGTKNDIKVALMQSFVDLECMSPSEAAERLLKAIKRNNKMRNDRQRSNQTAQVPL